MALSIEAIQTSLVQLDPDLLREAQRNGIAAAHIIIPHGSMIQPVDGMGIVVFPRPQDSEFDAVPVAIYDATRWERPQMAAATEGNRRSLFTHRVYGTPKAITSSKVR